MITDYETAYSKVKFIVGSAGMAENILISLGYTRPKEMSLRERYEATDSYRKLTIKHNIQNEEGVWQIYGEDPNCDLAGYHKEPLLETVEGKLTNVIDYAVALKGFWSWGGGGRIEKVTIKKPKKI